MTALAAQGSPYATRYSDIAEAFKDYYGNEAFYVGFAILILLVVGALFFAWVRPMLRKKAERARLFDELARAHRLGAEERKLIERLASRHRLADPLFVFVSRSVFVAERRRATVSSDYDALVTLEVQLFDASGDPASRSRP